MSRFFASLTFSESCSLRGMCHLRNALWALAITAFGVSLAATASGQTSSATLTLPAAPLLPLSFGDGWTQLNAPAEPQAPRALSLTTISKDALEECGPERSAVADYGRNGKTLHLEAIQFGDRSGAYSAYTLVKQPGMREGKEFGSWVSTGNGAVLFQQGGSIVLAQPATPADFSALRALAEQLPKVVGNKGVAPLLPTFVAERGLAPGSVRYALGPETYMAQGGVLPAASLAWNKSAEAVTAKYADKRGAETLTLLLYPTPQIAGAIARHVEEALPNLGPSLHTAKLRREGDLVILASGSFSPDEAQRLTENIHMRQELSFDKDVQPVFHTEVQKTFSLLTNIAILSGVLMLAAVLLGLFLGGGRALIRMLQGKSAATEPEFLSLHLAPQNAAPRFEPGQPEGIS